jgi:hypothetical protein
MASVRATPCGGIAPAASKAVRPSIIGGLSPTKRPFPGKESYPVRYGCAGNKTTLENRDTIPVLDPSACASHWADFTTSSRP